MNNRSVVFENMKKDFVSLCKQYRNDYKIFKNTHDKVAEVVIATLETNLDQYAYPNWGTAHVMAFKMEMLKAFAIALKEHLCEQRHSKKLNGLLDGFLSTYFDELQHQTRTIKSRYAAPINALKEHFKQNCYGLLKTQNSTFDKLDLFVKDFKSHYKIQDNLMRLNMTEAK